MKVKATINRITDKPESTVKAYASVSFDGAFAVHGIKVCENEKGRFVSMPSTSYKDRNGETKYSDIFHPISKGAREALNRSVLNAYDLKLHQTQTTEVEEPKVTRVEVEETQEEAEEAKEYPEQKIGM